MQFLKNIYTKLESGLSSLQFGFKMCVYHAQVDKHPHAICTEFTAPEPITRPS